MTKFKFYFGEKVMFKGQIWQVVQLDPEGKYNYRISPTTKKDLSYNGSEAEWVEENQLTSLT